MSLLLFFSKKRESTTIVIDAIADFIIDAIDFAKTNITFPVSPVELSINTLNPLVFRNVSNNNGTINGNYQRILYKMDITKNLLYYYGVVTLLTKSTYGRNDD